MGLTALLKITHKAWESRIANNIAMATLTLRLVILMHIANLLFAPSAKGHILPGEMGRVHGNHSIALTTGVPRGRCRCQVKLSRKDLSQPKENPVPRSPGNLHEDLQWLLRQSAMLAHNQNTDAAPKGKSIFNPVLSNSKRKEQIRNAFPKDHNVHDVRKTLVGEDGEDLNDQRGQQGQVLSAHIGKRLQRMFRKEFTDEHSWRQFIVNLEDQWTMRWGECATEICDLKTCRRKILLVACVGPCTKYRREECPEIERNICATSLTKCPSSSPCSHGDCNEQYEEGDLELDDRSEEYDGDDGDLSVIIDRGRDYQIYVPKNDGERDIVTADSMHPTKTKISNATLTKHYHTSTGKGDNEYNSITPPVIPTNHVFSLEREETEDPSTKRTISRSQQIASGIRYIWVVSCIVVPTLVFCVGYAIAMHLRRKRYLHRAQFPTSAPRGACDPILALPPYSTEDLFACPPGSVPGLRLPPPSYEDAIAEPSRNRTITECSAFSQEPLMSEETSRPVSPPPYEDIIAEPSTERRGHHRLPSYESVICLHTSI